MAREIKFRAWDKKLEEMINVSALCLDDNILIDGEPSIIDESNDIHLLKDCELMQYLGLNDKNGKEIYEGDIIVREEPFLKGEIKFRGYAWCVVQENNILTPIFMEEDFGGIEEFEVIGNIYQNI